VSIASFHTEDWTFAQAAERPFCRNAGQLSDRSNPTLPPADFQSRVIQMLREQDTTGARLYRPNSGIRTYSRMTGGMKLAAESENSGAGELAVFLGRIAGVLFECRVEYGFRVEPDVICDGENSVIPVAIVPQSPLGFFDAV
jgi:hypothetical protein